MAKVPVCFNCGGKWPYAKREEVPTCCHCGLPKGLTTTAEIRKWRVEQTAARYHISIRSAKAIMIHRRPRNKHGRKGVKR